MIYKNYADLKRCQTFYKNQLERTDLIDQKIWYENHLELIKLVEEKNPEFLYEICKEQLNVLR